MNRRTFDTFKAEVRELMGKYDLEIFDLSKSDELITAKMIPFSAHRPMKRDPRGAKRRPIVG